MKQLLKPAAFSIFVFIAISLLSFTGQSNKIQDNRKINKDPRIQVAILLDVSGSMNGLIDQAKAQLWNMVNTLGKTKCEAGVPPKIEIALYEYGRTTNNKDDGYVKQINGFINDLDSLSQNLFSLTTNGGDEFCGHVIYSSLNELQWDNNPENYKVIFIAGNEEFLQGDIHYTKACTEAKQKGVIVNTIYCGDRMQGIKEHWDLAGECGNGSFSNINHNAREEEIPTPYDSMIYTLNGKLNGTYVVYGYDGYGGQQMQARMDTKNEALSKSAGIKRIKAKSNAAVYMNSTWDLVDAVEKDGDGIIDKLDKKTLPDSLKNKSKTEIKKIVSEKSKERNNVRKEIVDLTTKRDAFIAAEKAKKATANNNAVTLETEVEKIIKEQARRFKMTID
jgi:hypothetical protein